MIVCCYLLCCNCFCIIPGGWLCQLTIARLHQVLVVQLTCTSQLGQPGSLTVARSMMLRSLMDGLLLPRIASATNNRTLAAINSVALPLEPSSSSCQQCPRSHHTSSSSSEPQHQEPDVQQLQQQLLAHALQHVKSLGWSRASLAAAAADMQLSSASVGMFPRGASQLVEHFISQQNAELSRELEASQQQYLALPLRQRITAAVRRRLELNAPYMDSWPQVWGWGSSSTVVCPARLGVW